MPESPPGRGSGRLIRPVEPLQVGAPAGGVVARSKSLGHHQRTPTASWTSAAISEHDDAASTVEIAESVGCHRDTARRRLIELFESGEIRRRDVGDAALWMVMGNNDE